MNPLPIACALTPPDLRERLRAIHTLNRDALVGYERDGFSLTLRYAPAAIGRVRDMAAAEQQCCAFLHFDIREDTAAVVVTLTAPQHARAAADVLFEQFIAMAEADR